MIRIYYDTNTGLITGSCPDAVAVATAEPYILWPQDIRICDYRVDTATRQLVELTNKPPIVSRRIATSL